MKSLVVLGFLIILSFSCSFPSSLYNWKSYYKRFSKNVQRFVEKNEQSARDVTINSLRTYLSTLIGIHIPFLVNNNKANAQRGAFEMDTEYYLRNLLGKQPQKPVFKQIGSFGTARHLDLLFAQQVVNIVFDVVSREAKIPINELQHKVQEKMPYYVKYFRTFAPIAVEDLSDQYYFDIVLYLLYQEAGNNIATSVERVRMRDRVGSAIFSFLLSQGYVPPLSTTTNMDLPQKINQLRATLDAMLFTYKEKGLIAGYVLDSEENLSDPLFIQQSFQQVAITHATCLSIYLYCVFCCHDRGYQSASKSL
jgi:hypothetical protein